MKRYIVSIIYLIFGIFFTVYPFYLNHVKGISLLPSGGTPYEPKNPGIVFSVVGVGLIIVAFFTFFRFIKPRQLPEPIYPYDKTTNKIVLPKNVKQEIVALCNSSTKSDAMIKVTELTGAKFNMAKEYIENLMEKK